MRAYLTRCRPLLRWLTALALFFAVYLTVRTSRAAMNWLCGGVIFPVMRRISRLCDFFDGSVGEVLLLTGIWAAVIWLACTVRRLATGPRRGAVLADFALTAGCIALTVYAGFCLLWGTAYNTDGFQEKSGVTAQPVSAEALERVTLYFAEELSAAAGEVPRNADGVCAADRKAILAAAGDAYDGIYEEFPFLRMETGRVKPFGCSRALSVLRFTGFYFPFTGEANVNMDSPVAYLPATVCHEMAHQRGIVSEQECSFLGILAATRCKDPSTATPDGWRAMSACPTPCTASTRSAASPSGIPCRRRCGATCGRTAPTGRSSKARCRRHRRAYTTRSSRGTAMPTASAATAW